MNQKFTAKDVLSLLPIALLGIFTFQAMGAILLDQTSVTYNVFPTIIRCAVIGLFIGIARKEDKQPYTSLIASLIIVSLATLITRQFSPVGEMIFGYKFGLHLVIEPLIAIAFSALGWYGAKQISNKILTISLAALAFIVIGAMFLTSANFYTKSNTDAYVVSHNPIQLSSLKYDGFDYAETLNRMNFNHQGYYQAYKDAWAGDSRVKAFSSIMFFRPSGMPTLLALLPGKTLYSVFLWWGLLLCLASLATYALVLKYSDASFAFISSILVGFTFFAIGCSELILFNWTFAEIPAAMVLLCAFALSVYKKWWPAALCFLLACATREFSLMFLPFPFIILFFQEKSSRKKGLIALTAMLAGVAAFYVFHYISAPVADANTGTKMNFISTWFHGSASYYSNYLTYGVKATWALSGLMILLPLLGILFSLCVKPLGEKIALAYIPFTLGLFYFFMGQNQWQNYWGGFGIPLLVAIFSLCSALAYVKSEGPEGPSLVHSKTKAKQSHAKNAKRKKK